VREIRPPGLEGGGALNKSSLPLSYSHRPSRFSTLETRVGKLFPACSQRGKAATKEAVNIMVYNFSASCAEVRGKESKERSNRLGRSAEVATSRAYASVPQMRPS
jgi:hypothetical protein